MADADSQLISIKQRAVWAADITLSGSVNVDESSLALVTLIAN
jgi:hypothetical protein